MTHRYDVLKEHEDERRKFRVAKLQEKKYNFQWQAHVAEKLNKKKPPKMPTLKELGFTASQDKGL